MRLILAFLISLPLLAADYDWLFRNARVIDGSGNPWYYADVAVKDGVIAAIGQLADADADRLVDASGRVLTPGFIDVHTHIERTLEKVPYGDNFVFDGVTTVVTGNCGGSRIDLVEWFRSLEEIGVGINVASLIGHNAVRREVMGTENRQATPEELTRMEELVEAAMAAGAVGLSTGLIYVPGTYAETAEIVALAKVASRLGGVYATHIRDEANDVLGAIEEAIEIGREADLPVEISHFKVSSKKIWGASNQTIELVEKARAEGIDVVVDQYPYDRSSTSVNPLFPSWALAGGSEKIQERLHNSGTRSKIAAGMEEILRGMGFENYSHAMVASFEPEPELEGKTISEINVLRGRAETLANEILTVMEIKNQGGAQMIYHKMSMEDVERIAQYRNTAVASDGGTREFGKGKPHPRSYGTNARVLAQFVRDRRILTLEDAIRKMTSLPARTFGFQDRGLIRQGLAADLLLFDPEQVQDHATFEEPHRFSSGFDLVLVNGESVVEDGKLTGRTTGLILRHHTHDSAQ